MAEPLEPRVSPQRRGWSGIRELLSLAGPLILSTSALTVQEFVDRMFLSWYSASSIAAALPAAVVNWGFISLFWGTAGYVSTFVAQYSGAGRLERIGPSIWQGLYVALAGALVNLLLAPLAVPLFALIGHPAEVQEQEAVYFRILCYGSLFPMVGYAFSGFFSGRGKPWPVLWVNASATTINVVLDYALIFGRLGFPELGIAGAAMATVVSQIAACLLYLFLFSRRENRRVYRTLSGFRPDRELLARLLRYGVPNGVHFLIDLVGFTAFILLVGRLGIVPLAATNIAFNINNLAFMPMLGLGQAISVLVGRYLGEGKPGLAERRTWSGFILSFIYMSGFALSFLLFPGPLVDLFAQRSDASAFVPLRQTVIVLLRFVAVYSLFDTMNIVFASALKGAGDTRFAMLLFLVVSFGVLLAPSILVLGVWKAHIYAAWLIVSAYIIVLGLSFLARFLGGKWKSMRVIEEA